MKKIYISLLMMSSLAFSLDSNAQWAPPASVPVISGTDINGDVHDIQSYLTAGKTVLIDISATWCGPCWGLHQSHWLENVHNILGPDGTDDVVVLWVEGDGNTNNADLNGTGSNTQGDWVTGVSYPIIDDATFSTEFNLSYYPTVFTICPDGTMTEVNRSSESALFNSIMTCSGVELPAIESLVSSGQGTVCGTEDVSVPYTLKNFGSTAVTSGTFNVTKDGANVHTEAYSGSTASLAETSGNLNFTLTGVTANDNFEVEFVNSQTEPNVANNSAEVSSLLVPQGNSSKDFIVKIHTDSFPSETKAYIFSQDGTLLLETETFEALQSGSNYIPGGPDADKEFEFPYSAGANECIQLFVRDTYGDGLSRPGANGAYVKIEDSEGTELVGATNADGNFGIVSNYVHTTVPVSVEENSLEVNFFPNPAVDYVIISDSKLVGEMVTIVDMNGRVVYSNELASDNKVDVRTLTTGNYVLKINNSSSILNIN